MKKLFFILLLISLSVSISASASPMSERSGSARNQKSKDVISGFWYTQDHDGIIHIYSCGDKICGRIHWLKPNDKDDPVSDVRNPDPDKKGRSLCKMQFMGDFMTDGLGHYTDGWIYSPRHGQTFSAEITLVDHDTLNLHGYLFTPILGEDQTWTRAKKISSCAGQS